MSANNLIIGKIYIDVHGQYEVINHTKNIKAEVKIHRQGWTAKNSYKCEGRVIDNDGSCPFEIYGRWNEYFDLKTVSSDEVKRIV